LVVHNYGAGKNVATIHIEVDADTTLQVSHDIADRVEFAVLESLGVALTVHLDPVDTHDQNLHNLKRIAKSYLETKCPTAHAHEFLINGNNLSFDLQLPHGLNCNNREKLIGGLINQLKQSNSDLVVKITEEFGFLEEDCH